ncbi:MAG: hypothetical protein FJ297_05500 [Planctomycetes bacterium]|nr:hypothetical protein [Planctomycetota bacterium]
MGDECAFELRRPHSPLGRLTWEQLEGLARIAAKTGDGGLGTTSEQGLIVTGIATGFRDSAATSAAALGLSPHADTLVRNTVACAGKQFCNIFERGSRAKAVGNARGIRRVSRRRHLRPAPRRPALPLGSRRRSATAGHRGSRARLRRVPAADLDPRRLRVPPSGRGPAGLLSQPRRPSEGRGPAGLLSQPRRPSETLCDARRRDRPLRSTRRSCRLRVRPRPRMRLRPSRAERTRREPSLIADRKAPLEP